MSRIPAKIGKYQIEDKIAEGGMGAVFRGTHPTLDKPVVLKKLTLSNNEHLIERFRREAKIMMEFSNENIVRVYDHFKSGQAWYIVQELVDGKSVDILLKKERYLRWEEALYIFYYACKALEYAHRNQVVHRDIKPANILVSKTGEIKLVDFGIAQSEEEDDALTKEGMALGTPSYMAPEQYDDSRNVSFKADIYSLGIMLYEMVTGKKPYPGKMNPETLARIHKGKYTAPKKINPTLPSSLNWYMKHCIQAKPQKRAASVSQLLKKLEKWYQSADTDKIREDLIRIVNDKERQPGKPPRKKAGIKIYLSAVLVLLIAAAGTWFYLDEMHFKTIYADQYGGLRLVSTLNGNEIFEPSDKIHMEVLVYNDEEGQIGEDRLANLVLKPVDIDKEGQLTLESSLTHLAPGAYWIKTMYDDAVWWQNINLSPYTDKSFLIKPAEETRVILKKPSMEPMPLRVWIDARDRHNGRNLNELIQVSVQPNGKPDFTPIEEIRDELTTGSAYNFKIESENYYPIIYNLGIKTHQDKLILEPMMIPREGWLRLKSSEELPENLEIKVNKSALLPPAGISSVRHPASELGKLTSLALPPGDYELELKSGKIVQTIQTSVIRDEETLLIIEIKRDKKNITELMIKAMQSE